MTYTFLILLILLVLLLAASIRIVEQNTVLKKLTQIMILIFISVQ
jgi:hypothetical protein